MKIDFKNANKSELVCYIKKNKLPINTATSKEILIYLIEIYYKQLIFDEIL